MHGLGNDFVVIDAVTRPVALAPEQLRLLAHRRLGVGCDQVLVVEPARSPEADFRYRIFNADGLEVEQCGNGARCLVRFLHARGLTARPEIAVETAGGMLTLKLEGDGRVTVDMGVPRFAPAEIPFDAEAMAASYVVEVEGEAVELAAVSMGNPHAVIKVDDVQTAPVAELGRRLESHPRFPNRVNVGFMQIVDRARIRLRVFERGVGETLACGSGACAAVAAGRIQGWLDERVEVELPGGQLVLSWRGGDTPVMLTGPAMGVFEGVIEL